ncbi:MAG: hypothetical protein SPJ13_02320 [Bacteroidales bacterium]|nr:hypothetical protein [Bacteroidales bacterium]
MLRIEGVQAFGITPQTPLAFVVCDADIPNTMSQFFQFNYLTVCTLW